MTRVLSLWPLLTALGIPNSCSLELDPLVAVALNPASLRERLLEASAAPVTASKVSSLLLACLFACPYTARTSSPTRAELAIRVHSRRVRNSPRVNQPQVMMSLSLGSKNSHYRSSLRIGMHVSMHCHVAKPFPDTVSTTRRGSFPLSRLEVMT